MSRIELDSQPAGRPPPEDDHACFGRPKGLLTLSGLEVWGRFPFLGMQAILVLSSADTLAHGGMGMSPGAATSASAASVSPASVSAAYGTLAPRPPRSPR